MLNTLANIFEAITFLAALVGGWLIITTLGLTSNTDPGNLMGLVAAAATAGALILPPYCLARIFHQGWHREFLLRNDREARQLEG